MRQDGREGASTRLSVLTQIISAPDGNRAIGDAGGKASEHHSALPAVHGRDHLERVLGMRSRSA